MTPGKDERDPLDDWLEREIKPLPPPPGTFTMITKRARRRKLGKLAITVTSAAAVAAAVVIAVPDVGSLHLGQPSVSGNPVANGRSSTPAPTTPASSSPAPGPGGPTASRPSATLVPSTSGTSTGPAGGGYPAGGPVPPNFQPTSVTFVSADEGWAIGQAGTPGQCANHDPTICTSIVRTNDRGHTWVGVPAPSTSRVGFIRFLDGINGWAFGPDLWSTHDRGNTWAKVNIGGQTVVSLEASGDKAFAVFGTCTSSSTCTDTLEATQAGTDNWSPVSPVTTGVAYSSGTSLSGTIVLGGGQGWLAAGDGTLYSGPLAGGPWQKLAAPSCPSTLSALTWVKPSGALVLSCSTQSGTTAQPTWTTTIYTSADGGQTWSAGTSSVTSGAVRSLSGSPNAPIIAATTAGIDVQSAAGQEKQVASLSAGFMYVGMTGNNQGLAVPANTSLHEIYMTYDGGLTWSPAKIAP